MLFSCICSIKRSIIELNKDYVVLLLPEFKFLAVVVKNQYGLTAELGSGQQSKTG
jgi:hypothetical protein